MAITTQPPAEIEIDEGLIRVLLRAQYPDLAEQPLRIVAHGWDNVLARLGDELLVRLPRRALAAPLIVHEQRWLPELAPHLPLPVPAPIRCGLPGTGFPWAWSIVPWFAGATAASTAPADPDAAADTLAAFLTALNRPAPIDAPANRFRGVPLGARQDNVTAALTLLGSAVDQQAVCRAWDAACALPPYDGPPLWIHGDLHPGNLIVRDGAIAAVVDFGDLTGGDPATDLAVAWMLFSADTRARFRAALGHGEATWRRAAGNALAHALACLSRSADTPWLAAVGRRTLAAVLGDV
jgi:aminoglycoside phosphotransferase (APT) family kinase protein